MLSAVSAWNGDPPTCYIWLQSSDSGHYTDSSPGKYTLSHYSTTWVLEYNGKVTWVSGDRELTSEIRDEVVHPWLRSYGYSSDVVDSPSFVSKISNVEFGRRLDSMIQPLVFYDQLWILYIHLCIEVGQLSFPKQKRSTEGCSKLKSPETRQVQERLVSTLEHMQVLKWDRTRCQLQMI